MQCDIKFTYWLTFVSSVTTYYSIVGWFQCLSVISILFHILQKPFFRNKRIVLKMVHSICFYFGITRKDFRLFNEIHRGSACRFESENNNSIIRIKHKLVKITVFIDLQFLTPYSVIDIMNHPIPKLWNLMCKLTFVTR